VIDTLKLRSPDLDADTFAACASALMTRATVDNSTGELISEFTFGLLDGSFDHRISARLMTSEMVQAFSLVDCKYHPVDRVCSKLVIEGSVHKAMLGHNVHGGPECPLLASRWFVAYVSGLLGVELPRGDDWLVTRIDIAEAFDLEDFDACAEYIHGLSLARFPRRKCSRWGDETIAFAGSTTCWKLYHKGPEFSKHDRPRLFQKVRDGRRASAETRLHNRWVESLQSRANGIIRVETSIKAHKLKRQYDGYPTAAQLTREWIESVHDRETERVLHEGKAEMETVSKTREVEQRLHSFYPERRAAALFGSWAILTAMGEDALRARLTRRTFYRHRAQLRDAGVSWLASDLVIVEHSRVPQGFRPVRSDNRRIRGEDPRVTAMLAPYATAV